MNAQKLGRHRARRSARLTAKRRSFLRHTPAIEQLERRNLMATLGSFLTTEHADINPGYSAGTWTLHVSDNDNFVLHETDDALIYVGAPATTSRVDGAAFDFIGLESGEDFYRLPQNQETDLMFLGLRGGAASGVFDRINPSAESKGRVSGLGRWLKASLVDVQHTTPSGAAGDGVFSVWQSGDTGPVVFMSSYDDGVSNPNGSGLDATDGIGPDDAYWVTASGHLHHNYGFTQKGRYEVTFMLSGYLDDGNTTSLGQFTESEPLTVYFSVGSVGQLEFDASTYVVNEDAGTASVTVRRVNGSDGQITVDYATSDGSAVADADYTETSGTLTFEDQETWKTITIPILADDAAETDETVDLTLSDPGPSNINDYLIDVEQDANGLLSEQVTATLTITEVDDPGGTFDARDDAYAVHSRNALVGNVLFNDSDPDRNALTTVLATEPSKGTVVLEENGSFAYMPDSSFDDSDSFTYTVSDGSGELDTAIVTITTAAAQDFDAVLKMGHADVGVAYEDDAWDLHVHDEETDTEYEPDEVLLYVGPQAEEARVEDARFDFIGVGAGETYWRLPDVDNPQLLFLGIGGEELEAGTFQGGEVQLHLKAVNGPGQFSVWQNTDTGPAVAMATSDGITGDDSLNVLEGGHAHYNWGFTALGAYEVTFEATGMLADGTAVASGDVTYFFEVPVAIDDAYTGIPGNELRGNVLFNDIFAAGDPLTAVLSTEPTNGSVVLEENGSFAYTPASSFDGSDSFTYTVSDDSGELDTAIVTITAAAAQEFDTVLKMGLFDIGIAYEDGWDLHVHDETNGAEHEPADVLLYVGPQAEEVRVEDARFDFIGVGAGETYWRLPDVENPELLFLGIGAEEIADGTFQGGNVQLQLKAVNGPGQFSLWQNTDTGPDVVMATSDGITGDDSLNVLEGGHEHYNWGFTALGAYEVTVEATGTLADGTEVASGDVTYFFEVPVAIDDTFTVSTGNELRGNVLFNDTAPDGAALTAALTTEPTNGTVVLEENGSFAYMPDSSFDDSDSFTYTVSDDSGELDTAIVTITAAAAQDFDAVLKMGHADVGVAYEGAWDLHVHDEENDVEYEPADVLLYVGPQAEEVRVEDVRFDFIGVGAGETYWRLPDVDNPQLLFLGIGGEELEAGTFQGGSVQLQLKVVNGPGQFSVWQNTDTGPSVAMATSDGITGDDSLNVLEGGHAHYNWGFTALGAYEVTFEATGTLADGTAVASGDVTYFFEVVPAAVDDSYTVIPSNQLVGNVLFNDISPDGDPLTAALTTAPTNGTVVLNENGSFTYMPDGSFDDSDSFTYTVSDDSGELDAAIVTITAAAAQEFDTVLKMGLFDIGIAYEDGWDLHVHDETNGAEHEPADVLLYVGPQAEEVRVEDARFDFIGVGAGETYWRLPDVENPELLFLGIGAEEIADGTFQGGNVQLQLKAVNGPGQFSLWQNTDTGPDVVMATSDGITGDDSLSVLEGSHEHYNWGFTALGEYEVTFEATGTLADGTAVASGDVTYFFSVDPPLVSVTSLDSSSSGFVASFSGDLDASGLNLFDTQADELGPPDVTLVGSVVGSVAGSLIVDPALREVSFIKTGGPLDPDTYTVTIRSAADGFVDVVGRLLDGDNDGTEGGDFVGTFTITEPAANTITLGIPDIVRGPGQPVNVPATATGVPVTISGGENVRTVDLRIAYDPSLLSITGAAVAPGIPDGSSVTVNTDTPGLAILAFVSSSPLPAGTHTIVNLQASIPSGIAGGAQRLDLHDATVSDGSGNQFPLIVDDGYQLVGYFGDVSGNGTINALDASRVAQFAALIDTGFAVSLLTDPVILGDISGNGRVNAGDASLIAQFAALLDVPEIPPLPAQAAAAALGALANTGTLLDPRDGDDRREATRLPGGPDSSCDSPWRCSADQPAAVDMLMAGLPAATTAADHSRVEALEVAVDELFEALNEVSLLSD